MLSGVTHTCVSPTLQEDDLQEWNSQSVAGKHPPDFTLSILTHPLLPVPEFARLSGP